MVSAAISFICECLGSNFSRTRGEFPVFLAAFAVNTGLEATVKQRVHFYYVQPTTSNSDPKF
jgi:hypothetical protein